MSGLRHHWIREASRAEDYRAKRGMNCLIAKNFVSAYYRELGLGMKKKKHGQLLSVKDVFKWATKTP